MGIEERYKFNDNEEEKLDVYKLYVGKMCYKTFDGKTIEEDDYSVVGLFNYMKHDFYDVLNYKSIPIWDNKNEENNVARYVIRTVLPFQEYLELNNMEYSDTITRKELRNMIEPENVKDPILKRIAYIFNKIENSSINNDEKEQLKKNLLDSMNLYVENMTKKDLSIIEQANLLKKINEKINLIEYMSSPHNLEEIQNEGKRLKKRLFNKEKD